MARNWDSWVFFLDVLVVIYSGGTNNCPQKLPNYVHERLLHKYINTLQQIPLLDSKFCFKFFFSEVNLV